MMVALHPGSDWRMCGTSQSIDRLAGVYKQYSDMAECPAGIDVAEIARFGDDLEHSMHGDGSFDKEAGVYRLYARCRRASR